MPAARLTRQRAQVAVVVFYLLVRAIDAVMIVVAGSHGQRGESPWGVYQDVTTSWDGGWYSSIAREGYPDSAVGPDGAPVQTSLAFYPLFPLASRALSAVTGLPFSVVGPALSLVAGAVATALVLVVLERTVGVHRAALACCVLTVFPSAPVLQAAYTESLALALVATAILLIQRRSYLWATLPVLGLGLTRNISLVLAAVVVAHWVVAWRAQRRRPAVADQQPGPAVPHARLAVLLASTGVAALLWPAIVGLLTGDPHAYTTTMKAWPGFSTSVLRPPWVEAVGSTGSGSVVLAIIVVLGFAALMSLPVTRAWGVEPWSWAVAYPLYIFLATGVSTSILRYLLLAFPLALAVVPPVRTSRDRVARAVLVGGWCLLGLAGQYLWIAHLLVRHDPGQHWGFP
jgi:hypothetical protein